LDLTFSIIPFIIPHGRILSSLWPEGISELNRSVQDTPFILPPSTTFGYISSTFYLHLKECEFRFNNRNTYIYKLLLKNFKNKPLF